MKKTYKVDVDCANCANLMEDAAKKTAGVKDCSVSFMTLKMKVEFDEGADVDTVMKNVRDACKKVTGTYLFDVYEGSQIPADKKSMAFTVTFTPDEEEFTTEMVDGYVHKILKNLKKSLDIEMRV